MKNKLKTIDLFAGCGGLTEGFEMSGKFSTVAVVEWDKSSLNTLVNRLKTKWNHADAEKNAMHFDMQRTEELLNGWKDDKKYGTNVGLRKIVKESKQNVDVIVGGPPCQAYSIAGRVRDKDGMKNDYRNYLFETYISVVDEFRPKAFIFENVLGMLSASPSGRPIPDLIKESFGEIGYEIIDNLKEALVDVSEYGVPQVRKRLVIVGINKTYFKGNHQEILKTFYTKILPKHKQKKVSVIEAIGDLPKMKVISNGKVSHQVICKNNLINHNPRYHSPRDIEIFRELAKDITRKEKIYKTINDIKRLYTEKTGKTSSIHKYYVLDPNKPSNTIVAHLHKDGLRHIHPDPTQARSITPREAGRLQSFPDDFYFLGGMGDQYKMIGNAVPPLMAKAVAESLYELIEVCSRGNKSSIIDSNEYRTSKIQRERICA